MPTVAETFKREMLARLQAAPLSDYGNDPPHSDRIRRSHLTVVDRNQTPAIYLRAGDATRRGEETACPWKWEMYWRVSVYVRDDASDLASDPIVLEVVARLNPMVGVPYSNGVDLRLTKIEVVTEIADADAQCVDVVGVARYNTNEWALDEAMR
jgi:hypothetical protein